MEQVLFTDKGKCCGCRACVDVCEKSNRDDCIDNMLHLSERNICLNNIFK